MDPLAVLRTLWHHKFVSLPVFLITMCAAVYVFQFAPRSFESTVSYAMINPDLPSEADLVKNPELGTLNTNNPYLRSSDPSLIVQVILTRINDGATGDLLKSRGFSADYTASRGVGGSNGFLVDITGIGHSPEESFATTRALGEILEKDLHDLQKVNGADDLFLFDSIVIAPPVKATEQFSSRLRSVIVVLLGGAVLMFGAVSISRSASIARSRKHGKVRKSGGAKSEGPRRRANDPVSGSSTHSAYDGKVAPHPIDAPLRLKTEETASSLPQRPEDLPDGIADDGHRISELAR